MAALCLLYVVSSQRGFHARKVELSQVPFFTFRQMCIKSCSRGVFPYPLKAVEDCDSTLISSRYIDYQNSCTHNPANCALEQVGCKGIWKMDELM